MVSAACSTPAWFDAEYALTVTRFDPPVNPAMVGLALPLAGDPRMMGWKTGDTMRHSRSWHDALALVLLLWLAGCGGAGGGRDATGEAPDALAESADETGEAQAPAPDPFLRDDQGRALILHGLNVSSSAKTSPDRMPALSREDVRIMAREWGFNSARFLLTWDGLEPQRGQINQHYLDLVKERLDWFAQEGMRVILDMHQDVYSIHTCGNGAPEWAVQTDGQPIQCPDQWFLGYFEPGVQRAFDNFWNWDGPHRYLQEHYMAAWQAVAERFRDHPAVLGYDLINEPHPGSMADVAELLGKQNPDSSHYAFDQQYLGPFYQRVLEAVRQKDQDGWVFFEPRYGAPGNGLPSRLPVLTDPRAGSPRLSYYPHLYSLKVEGSGVYDPSADPCIPGWESNRSAEVAAQGGALLLGEFGLDTGHVNARQWIRDVLAMADRRLAGWHYWSFDPGSWFMHQDRTLYPGADELVRVYARAVAGTPLSFSYDPEARTFQLEVALVPGVGGPNELAIPPAVFAGPEDWTLGVTVGGSAQGVQVTQDWDAERRVLSVGVQATGPVYVLSLTPR
jgi:endoglycosylceramidase